MSLDHDFERADDARMSEWVLAGAAKELVDTAITQSEARDLALLEAGVARWHEALRNWVCLALDTDVSLPGFSAQRVLAALHQRAHVAPEEVKATYHEVVLDIVADVPAGIVMRRPVERMHRTGLQMLDAMALQALVDFPWLIEPKGRAEALGRSAFAAPLPDTASVVFRRIRNLDPVLDWAEIYSRNPKALALVADLRLERCIEQAAPRASAARLGL